ncbi:MAG: excinuclease ABC subunit UvrC [Bacilli bacterium]
MIRAKLALTPKNSGCYLMKNKEGTIIYVGKAKNLKNRLSSYFNGSHNGKTALLVSEIVDFEFIITNTEVESLVLELNLIKKYNPYYNILLKDDKTYPYIEISKERYPRLTIVRNINIKREKSRLFGPYPNVTAARETVNLLGRIYPLRKCVNMPKKVCLYYHINECLGYCEKNISKEEINNMTNEIIKFLKGDHSIVTKKIKEKLNKSILNLQFESSQQYKELLDYIEITLNRQKININDGIDRDVFGIYFDKSFLSIQVFFLRGGKLTERSTTILPLIDDEYDMITDFIAKFYEKNNILPKELLVTKHVNINLISQYLKVKVVNPLRGEKKSILNMACVNAKQALELKINLLNIDEKRTKGANDKIGQLLSVDNLHRIEIFDNSNLFGTFTVSGMVVFIDGKKCPNEYRKYKISIDNNDDVFCMKEVMYRRYFKVLKDSLQKPDLILVDGGINQMNVAKEVLESLGLNIPIAGLKKNNKHTTNALLDMNLNEIPLSKSSDEFLLLKKMQDEVHDYTINYHKKLRSKGSLSSILDNIATIGNVTKTKLLKKHKTINNIKSSSDEELLKILNIKQLNNLRTFLNNLSKEE